MFVFLVPQISQVMMKYEMVPQLHNSADLLCGTTAATTQLGKFPLFGTTAAELLLNSVDLLCGATVAEINNAVSLMHASGVAHIFQRQLRTMLKSMKA